MLGSPDQAFKDLKRDEMFKKEGFETIRFKADDAKNSPHECVSQIVSFFENSFWFIFMVLMVPIIHDFHF